MKSSASMVVNSYWKLLRHLSNEVKLRLIAKLSESLVNSCKEKEEENLANEFYGAWEDSKTAEELIEEINQSRTFNREIVSF